MSKAGIQLVAIVALTALAAGLLFLIGYTFHDGVKHITPDGKVPLVDAGLFTTFLLSFQQTVTTMRSIWESQERAVLTDKLAASSPVAPPAVEPATPEGA